MKNNRDVIHIFLWLAFLFINSSILFGQSEADSASSGWGVYPVTYYTDQTNLAFGVYGMHYFKNDQAQHTSNINTVAIYTLRKQIILEFGAQLYWQQNRMLGTVNYMKFPNTFYGIGNNTEVEDAEEYTDEGAQLNLNYQQQVMPNLFIGLAYNVQSHALVSTEPDGQLTTGLYTGTEKPFIISGAGLSLDFDTRDHVNFPLSGSFFRATWLYYTKTIASDYNFIRYEIDLRHFLPLFSNGILGFQGTWTQVTNGAPILVYPVLGDDRLRGFSARYWDKNLLTLQMEYRQMIWGHFGFVLFAGMGDVSDKISHFKMNAMKFGAGFGLRYMVLPDAKFNLRIDFGIGTYNNSSLTFLVGEAF